MRVIPSAETKPRFRSSLKCKLVTVWIKLPRPPTHIHTITSVLFLRFIIYLVLMFLFVLMLLLFVFLISFLRISIDRWEMLVEILSQIFYVLSSSFTHNIFSLIPAVLRIFPYFIEKWVMSLITLQMTNSLHGAATYVHVLMATE